MILDTFAVKQRSLDALQRCLQAALHTGAKSLYLLACDNNELRTERLDPILRSLPVPVFGGRFPCIVHNNTILEHGWIVSALDHRVDISLHRCISSCVDADLVLNADVADCPSLVVILDAMSENIEHLMSELYSRIGPSCTVLGGGAGSLSYERRPCVFTNDGLLDDCLQIVGLHNRIGVNTRHGWTRLAGPYLVTDADGNTIKTLNYRAALDVYKDAIGSHCDMDLHTSALCELSKSLPFGIETLGADVLVRDPVIVRGNELTCIGYVPESAIVYVLQAQMNDLLAAASDAALACQHEQGVDLLLFDCITRKLFMDGEFEHELDAFNARLVDGAVLVGALSLGEIANTASGSVQLHSKSVVLGAAARTPASSFMNQLQE